MFIRFDRMYERDRHTPHDGIGRACIASRDKNATHVLSERFMSFTTSNIKELMYFYRSSFSSDTAAI